MVDLVPYIRDMLARGYKLNDIRNYLIQYEHDIKDIDDAIGIIYHKTPEQPAVIEHHHKVSLSKQTIITLVLMTILFLGGLSVIIKEFWMPDGELPFLPTQLLDVKTSSQFSSILPGSDLLFNIEAFNLGGQNRYDILLEHTVSDMANNIINKKTETIALETRASITSSIKISDTTPEGNYVLKTVAKYDEQEAIASFMFRVAKESVPIKTTTSTTRTIVTTSITTGTTIEQETCFDSIINQDETGIDCGGICGPCTKSDVQITKDLKALDQSIQKEAYCYEIEDDVKRDGCLLKVALQTVDAKYCDLMLQEKRRDDCFMSFITSYDFFLENQLICDLIVNKQYSETCYLLYENFY